MAQRVEETSIDVLDKLHEDLSIPVSDITSGLRLTDQDIERWRENEGEPEHISNRLSVLVQLRDGLYDLFAGPSDVQKWMRSELRYLHWQTPRQVIREGNAERVYAAFEALASGIFL